MVLATGPSSRAMSVDDTPPPISSTFYDNLDGKYAKACSEGLPFQRNYQVFDSPLNAGLSMAIAV